jgi:hypothetical protein
LGWRAVGSYALNRVGVSPFLASSLATVNLSTGEILGSVFIEGVT